MDIKNIKKINYYEVPLDDGKFALMDQNDFDKFTVGKPTDAIAKASGRIEYIVFEIDDKKFAIPESKFETYIANLNK
jgi:translation elongation factor P/translation initiation factor 5A